MYVPKAVAFTSAKINPKAFETTLAIAKGLKEGFERDEIKRGSDVGKIMSPYTKGLQFCAARIGNPNLAGSFDPVGSSPDKMAYIIYGPLFSEKSNEEKVSSWCHEIFHLFNNLAFPKMLVRPVAVNLIQYRYDDVKGNISAVRDFSSKYLYCRHHEVAEPELSASAKEDVCRNVKKQMKKLFSSSVISSAEKIDVLQDWRYQLIDERAAYSAETIITKSLFAPKEISQKQHQLDVDSAVEKTLEPFLFDEKIKIIENQLKAEIKKHRIAHARKLRAQKQS